MFNIFGMKMKLNNGGKKGVQCQSEQSPQSLKGEAKSQVKAKSGDQG